MYIRITKCLEGTLLRPWSVSQERDRPPADWTRASRWIATTTQQAGRCQRALRCQFWRGAVQQ